MQIPTGDFGKRLTRLNQSNIQPIQTKKTKSASALVSTAIGAWNHIANQIDASNQLDAKNKLFDYQAALDDVNNDVLDRYATGKITYDQIPDEHQKLVNKVGDLSFDKLDETTKKTFELEKKQVLYANKLGMLQLFNSARKEHSKKVVETYVDNTNQTVQTKDSSLQDVKAGLKNSAFETAGKAGFDDWSSELGNIDRQLESTYLQSQMRYASMSDDPTQLQNLKQSLMDDNKQFGNLTAVDKVKYKSQIDALVDINVGRTTGKSLVSNVSQLVDKTGDFSAVNAYELLKSFQQPQAADAGSIGSGEQGKQIAKALGDQFDEKRFNDDPKYAATMQQDYFNKMLDQYGSPEMAVVASKVGTDKLNGWLKAFGDPNKDQISMDDFIAKIPDKAVKQQVTTINQKLKDTPVDSIDIEGSLAAIDNDSSLNSNQKLYAKTELRQYLETTQKQLQTTYRTNQQSVWQDIFINKTPLSDIDPARITQLSSQDQAILLAKPKQTLDVAKYSEAKGRLTAGDDFNVLREYGRELPIDQLGQLLNLQQELENDPDKKNTLFITTSMVADKSKLFGITDKSTVNRLNDSITDELAELEQTKGRKATQQEISDIADKQILKAKLDQSRDFKSRDGVITNTNLVNHVSQIPQNNRQKISDALKEQGLPVTDENIMKVYNGVKNGYAD